MPSLASSWRHRCRELGLDPQEIKSVSRRYDMYRDYNQQQGTEMLELGRWYKWYRVEKLSEGHAMLRPPEQGCSIQPDGAAPDQDAPVVSEHEFLALLENYRATAARR